MIRMGWGILLGLCWLGTAYGKPTNRYYIINPNTPENPVEIKKRVTGAEVGIILRDPMLPGQRKTQEVKVRKNPVRRQAPKLVPAKLAFKPLKIKGERRDPRVTFKRRQLPVGRVDEPVSADFYSKILERGFDDGL